MVLVVEDSRLFQHVCSKTIQDRLGMTAITAGSFAEARAAWEQHQGQFVAALVDIRLPDSMEGEVVQWLTTRGLPCIAFTGTYSDEIREKVLSYRAIDYFIKGAPMALEQATDLMGRLQRNQSIVVMVVDDSGTARSFIAEMLRQYRFTVLEARNAKEALDFAAKQPGIRLVLTDFNMPGMDGVEMVRHLRTTFGRDQMAIIGMSSAGNSILSARFIKNGANDFITKPFLREEFYCRISQNIENLELIAAYRDAATKDFLTGLYNRRMLFDLGRKAHAAATQKHAPLAVALLDVDHFKAVNDGHGHDVGDAVLKAVSQAMRSAVSDSEILARHGGEEFCILSPGLTPEAAPAHFDRLRQAIAATSIPLAGGASLSVTVSIGLCTHPHPALDAAIIAADTLLYRAKETGRNRVVAG